MLAGFAIAAVSSVLIALAALYSFARLEADRQQLAQADELVVALQAIQALTTDAEAASRGYAITGDQLHLLPYVRATTQAAAQLERLHALTAADEWQASRHAVLASLVTQRLELASTLVQTRTSEGFEAAQAAVAAGNGKRVQAAIGDTVAQMSASARGLYEEQAAETRRGTLITKLIVGFGGLFALVTALTARAIVRSDYAGSKKAHRELNEANAHLDARVGERTAELTRALERLQLTDAAFRGTQDGIVITDRACRVLAVNPAFSRISEYGEGEIIGQHMRFMQSGKHDRHFYQQMWDGVLKAGAWHGAIWNRRKSGELFQAWLSLSRIQDAEGHTTHYIGITTDAGRMNRVPTDLERLAHHDALTGLPNRLLLMSRLEHSIERARRDASLSAVLFLDLDRFKQVNDSRGHAAGDELLKRVAERMRGRLREVDTVARLGGDEFVVVLEGLADVGEATRVADALIDELRRPFDLGEFGVARIGTSIGISLYPLHAGNRDALLETADKALYLAKSTTRNTWRLAPQPTAEAESESSPPPHAQSARMGLRKTTRVKGRASPRRRGDAGRREGGPDVGVEHEAPAAAPLRGPGPQAVPPRPALRLRSRSPRSTFFCA